MTTQLQKIADQITQILRDIDELSRRIKDALDWITAHDKAASEAAKIHADSKTWFWRTVFASVIVFVVGGALNGFVMIIGIVVSLLLNDKFAVLLSQLSYQLQK